MAHTSRPGWRSVDAEFVRRRLRAPAGSDHKYTRGVVLLATGSAGFPGAAVLGAQAAARGGAGMLRYAGPDPVGEAVLAARPEVVRGEGRHDSLVIGSGLADLEGDPRRGLIAEAESAGVPIVADAGALSAIRRGTRGLVVTPHAGELERLLGRLPGDAPTRAEIERDPGSAALRAADALDCAVLLKGGTTRIARGEHRLLVESPTAWLATAGTGDVLAGLLGALLATAHAASAPDPLADEDVAAIAAAGAWVHARAGWVAAQRAAGASPGSETIVADARGLAAGPAGGPITASDAAAAIPAVIGAVLAS
ncbi:NAD(P)H-hydrate dehydratase [Gulosibacter sp. 10]|uniref:ADP-dependent NAD(P)H-hydrate dehydratase n=1 Tax=Gulosibacter sp. 10 TaxID=1255570 RepID=UPI00097F21CA|nr:NAD(P)H-hydrate dehydratase [Gulosibacter sp. 10]SJM57552.1 NAD(P)HX epimerase / NAD(P)HX dehydratase [Gulosibacter sp. 10]